MMTTRKNVAAWLLCLFAAAAIAGCAWTETQRDYPRSAFRDAPAPHVHR